MTRIDADDLFGQAKDAIAQSTVLRRRVNLMEKVVEAVRAFVQMEESGSDPVVVVTLTPERVVRLSKLREAISDLNAAERSEAEA